MPIGLVWINDPKACKIIVIIFVVIALILLCISFGYRVYEQKISSSYELVEAVVIENYQDGEVTWSLFKYTLNHETTQTKMNIYQSTGEILDLFVNPADSSDIVMAKSLGFYPVFFLCMSGFFAMVDVFYIINYVVINKKNRTA